MEFQRRHPFETIIAVPLEEYVLHATEFEFRHRFWLILLTYFAGFLCYRFDHQNVADALARWIFGNRDPHLQALAARGLLVLSAALVAVAAGIRTWAGAYLRADVVFDTKVHSDRLVADGPYRHLRNPLYLGNLIVAAGIAMLFSRIGATVLLLGNLLIILRLIGREQAALVASQGDSYRAFLEAVPKLWPSLSPRLPSGGMTPRWRQAFLGELHLWILAADGFILPWRMDRLLYYRILAIAGISYFLMRTTMRLARTRAPRNL